MDKESRLNDLGNFSYELSLMQKQKDNLLEKYREDFALPEGTPIKFKRKFYDMGNDKHAEIKVKASFKGVVKRSQICKHSFSFCYDVFCEDLQENCTVWENNIVGFIKFEEAESV